ncbi:MAG: hypothetical protein IIX65_09345 [Lachnospiraceae bacterium]|nr:hypothetical protein [Lachnospiraceae bacterium]
MTREEALNDWLPIIRQMVKGTEVYTEALDMSIKALEQEPCGDAVSRQAVLEVIRKCHCEEWVKADIGAPIEALPSVTPQPKTGQWIVLKDEFDDVCEAVCSCCDKNGNHKWAFCPYCGAKMPEIPTGAEGSE